MITLTKGNFYSSTNSLRLTKADSKDVKEISISNILFHLGEVIEFGEDLTFKQLFDIIIYHKEFFNILFCYEMDGLNIDEFISDYKKDVLPESSDRDYIIIFHWLCELYDFENDIEFYDGIAFQGVGRVNNDDNTGYLIGLSLTSISEYKDKLVVSDNGFEIQSTNSYIGEAKSLFKANYKPFTLYGIIAGILREISYNGTPEQREEYRKELEKNQKEIKKWIDEGGMDEYDEIDDEFEELEEIEEIDGDSFWDFLYPESNENKIVEILKKQQRESNNTSLEQQLKDAHDSEDYEKAAKIKKIIDKKKKK